MIQQAEAVYENGVLGPLNPVSLLQAERVTPSYSTGRWTRAASTMIATDSTHGLPASMDVQTLREDNSFFPSYDAAIAVRDPTLRSHPGLTSALAELSGKTTNQTMQWLDCEVGSRHLRAARVAGECPRIVH